MHTGIILFVKIILLLFLYITATVNETEIGRLVVRKL